MNESNRSHTLKLTKDNIKEWKEEYDKVFSNLGIEVSSPPSEMVSDQEHLYMWADCTPHEAAMEELSCWSE
jgi:hypothetical protein